MKQYIIALDQGTTSSRAVIFDNNSQIREMVQKEFKQIYPQPGWVEHDPMEIYASQYAVLVEAVAKSGIGSQEIAAIGITNQRETTIVWDRRNGKPVYNAIVWQCRRTADIVEQIHADGLSDYIRENTGLIPDAYFSATKIKWILDHVEGARELAQQGHLLCGTVDTWLIWKLTEGRVFATDRTNASRTMLYNIRTLQWDSRLCDYFGIPASMLPEVKASSDDYGTVSILGRDVPICGVAGDQQAALYGQACFSEGDVKNTYGTGCFLLMNIGNRFITSQNGLLTTIAASAGGSVQYALEGSVFVGGALIQWLRDEMRLITDAADTEYFARKAGTNNGVYIVPAFTGLGAPYWDMYSRGTIVGMTRGTNRAHIVRAALEAICYQSYDLFKAMVGDRGGRMPHQMNVDGGASANSFMMQFQADILGVPVVRPVVLETTALGVALMAGIGVGLYNSKEEAASMVKPDLTFRPGMEDEKRETTLNGWHRAVERSFGWIENK